MASIPLTVLIPCKNERDNIRACVDSVATMAAEILVADSGSTDGTPQIAGELGCRVVGREYINCGDFKNWAIPQARHAWVLIVDADERVTPELAAEIGSLLERPPCHDGYWLRRRNYFLGQPLNHGAWGRDTVIRLVRRDVARYSTGSDHAEVLLPPDRVGLLAHPLLHYSCWDYATYIRKMLGYTTQQAQLWHAAGRRPSLWRLALNGPARFLRSYFLECGFLDGSLGFQLAVLTGFYSFLKQAQLWQLHHGQQPVAGSYCPVRTDPPRGDGAETAPRRPANWPHAA
jgi:glycosyltransferase involved in cell wall biosynthesis